MPELAETLTRPGEAPRRRPSDPSPPRGAAVGAVGVALPATAVPNESIAARLGVTDRWIVARTGVRERRVAAASENVVGYGAAAGSQALAAAGLEPEDVDLVLVATMSHDLLTPSAAALVAADVGASGAGAIDVGAACTGFVSALSLATAQVEAGRASSALVIGVDLMSRIVDPDDRSTAALFGDGAGAVVVRASAGEGRIGPFVLGADGARGDFVRAERAEGLLRMKGHDTFRQAVDRLAEATVAAVAAAGRSLEEIDLFVFHQANGRILSAVGERLGLDAARVIDSVAHHGNTSAASIPLALAEAQRAGMLTEGARALLAAFGGGLTWGATVVEWGTDDGS